MNLVSPFVTATMNESSKISIADSSTTKEPHTLYLCYHASMCMACQDDAILSSTQGKIVVGVIRTLSQILKISWQVCWGFVKIYAYKSFP